MGLGTAGLRLLRSGLAGVCLPLLLLLGLPPSPGGSGAWLRVTPPPPLTTSPHGCLDLSVHLPRPRAGT